MCLTSSWQKTFQIWWLQEHQFSSVQSLSRVRLFATPMDRSMPGLPVHCQLLESTQTCVHWVSDARTYLDLIYCFWVCLKGVSVVNLSFCVLPKWSWKSTGEIHNFVAPHIALELKHLHTVHPFSLVGTCGPDMSSLISVVICLFGDLQKWEYMSSWKIKKHYIEDRYQNK